MCLFLLAGGVAPCLQQPGGRAKRRPHWLAGEPASAPYPFVGFTQSLDALCRWLLQRPLMRPAMVMCVARVVRCCCWKPLEQAVADGDNIQAIIRATGVNADGSRRRVSPSPARWSGRTHGQFSRAAVSGQKISDFVQKPQDRHLGDPIETAAIGAVYGRVALSMSPADRIGQNQRGTS